MDGYTYGWMYVCEDGRMDVCVIERESEQGREGGGEERRGGGEEGRSYLMQGTGLPKGSMPLPTTPMIATGSPTQ